ncbi:MAG: Lrp/AsnC family transcriptional regulator [Candidatus Bathyarchaeota archaeon]|nr:MAG: Lrp/AsnC family transcriptional regulator [Candidatus Bathyarchaeota archaeon]
MLVKIDGCLSIMHKIVRDVYLKRCKMVKRRELDRSILFELMKNSKISDRQMAKKLGVSQPTVTRRRARLEQELIAEYTVIPRWKELGYKILAIILVKAPLRLGADETLKNSVEKSMQWLKKQPNVIFGGECRGLAMTGIMITVHKTYGALDEFLSNHRQQLGPLLEEVEVIVVNLAGKGIYRHLSLRHLAEAYEKDQS